MYMQNNAQYESLMNSIRIQKYTNFRPVLIDGSDYATYQGVKSYGQKHNIKVIKFSGKLYLRDLCGDS